MNFMAPLDELHISLPEWEAEAPPTDAQRWAGVCRMGGIGDNLIAASVLGPLHRQGFKIEVISQEPFSSVFVNNPYVSKLTLKKPEDIPQGQLEWQQWFFARGKEYARFANLSHSCETLGALFPAQTAFYWPASMRRRICGRNYLELVHDILEVPYEFERLFWPTEGERKVAAETKARIGKRIIGWCLSGTRLDKIYPYSPMIVARIIKEIGAPVVLIGAPGKNFEMAQTIQEHVRRQNGSEAGLHVAISPEAENKSWPIRRGLAFAQACDLVVTPDTGPAWAVAFEPMPKVMLLSHASPENITKWWINTTTLHAGPEVTCWSCHRLHDSKDTCTPNREGNGAACISDISVECLMTAIKAAWGCQSSLARMRSEWASHAILPATPVGSDTSASAKPAPDIACDATSIGSSRSIDRDSKSANGGAAMGKPSTPQIAQPAMSGQELITPTIAPNAARSGKPDGNNTPSMSDD